MKILNLTKRVFNRATVELSLRTGLSLSKPTFVCAKMTMRCNSRCAHCDIWKIDYNEKELTTAQWFHVLDGLRSWLGTFYMYFTGGEALLRHDMPEILEYAVKIGIRVELLSNGLIFDEELARRVVSTGIEQITISLDGVTPAVHDRFRGEPGYHVQTIAAIEMLNRFRQEANAPMKVLLKTVISANNLHELEALAKWAQVHGCDLLYQPIEQNYGEKPDPTWYLNSPVWITDLHRLRNVLDSLRLLRDQGGSILNSDADFERYYSYFAQPESLMKSIQAHHTKDGSKFCPSAVGSFVISSNGDVRMCFGMAPIGNVAEISPREIWRRRKRCWAAPCGFR